MTHPSTAPAPPATSAPRPAAIRVRPIHSEADYTATLDEIAGLMSVAPDTPAADRLDVLTALVEAYEAKHYPIDPPDPIAAIRFRMEQQGLTAQDLEPFIGTRARVSEVLNRRRPLSLAMIRRLTEGLGIAAAVLIRPTEAPPARKTPPRGTARNVVTRGGRTVTRSVTRTTTGKGGTGATSPGRAANRGAKNKERTGVERSGPCP